MRTKFLKQGDHAASEKPVRLTRKKRPACPCVVRHRISGKWLVDSTGPVWSDDREHARTYPSQVEARMAIRSIGGAIPFVLMPAKSKEVTASSNKEDQ